MRLWLDEMISAEVARHLRQTGYDVAAVQEPEHRWAWGLDDTEQLDAAARQERALVSYNLRDLIPLALHWAQDRRAHWGIVLVHPRTIPQQDIGGLVRYLALFLAMNPGHEAMKDRVIFLTADQR